MGVVSTKDAVLGRLEMTIVQEQVHCGSVHKKKQIRSTVAIIHTYVDGPTSGSIAAACQWRLCRAPPALAIAIGPGGQFGHSGRPKFLDICTSQHYISELTSYASQKFQY